MIELNKIDWIHGSGFTKPFLNILSIGIEVEYFSLLKCLSNKFFHNLNEKIFKTVIVVATDLLL